MVFAARRVDATFRFGDFWRSIRGYPSRADVAVIPRLVKSFPTACSAVSDQQRPRLRVEDICLER